MAELPDVFKASKEETMEDSMKPVPAGWYPAMITRSEIKETRNGKGKYLSLQFKIIEDEDHANRLIFKNLNIINQNETAVQIAKRELASICNALDLESVLDTEELHGNPMKIKVSIVPETPDWPAKNDIKAYKSIDEAKESSGDSDNPFG